MYVIIITVNIPVYVVRDTYDMFILIQTRNQHCINAFKSTLHNGQPVEIMTTQVKHHI